MLGSTSRVHIEPRPATVWAVVTDPEYVKQWQCGSVLRTTWAVNAPIRFTSERAGQTFEQWGTVLAVEPSAQLRYSLFAP
ncbi:MAG: SRPBCC domain-containing protein [Mycobacteriales bacterium]